MAILIDCTTVVITTASLDARFPGGCAAFAQRSPNRTYRSDGVLAAVSFMVFADALAFAVTLTKHGFVNPTSAVSEEIAVIDQTGGFLTKCDWLHVDMKAFRTAEGKPFGATIAWKGDAEPRTFAAPAGWTPHAIHQISLSELKEKYELVKVEQVGAGSGTVAAYRHRETGEMRYIGRPSIASEELRERCAALLSTLRTVSAMPVPKERAMRAADLFDRATALVEETSGAEIGPLYVQGVAARLAGRWSAAESAFRRVTEGWPDTLDAWLELTWALASLGRLDEAIAAARRGVERGPESAAAHGNLANALLQSGRPEEALPPADRALELDAADWKNQEIRKQVAAAINERRMAEERPVDAASDAPWYRRWFR